MDSFFQDLYSLADCDNLNLDFANFCKKLHNLAKCNKEEMGYQYFYPLFD